MGLSLSIVNSCKSSDCLLVYRILEYVLIDSLCFLPKFHILVAFSRS